MLLSSRRTTLCLPDWRGGHGRVRFLGVVRVHETLCHRWERIVRLWTFSRLLWRGSRATRVDCGGDPARFRDPCDTRLLTTADVPCLPMCYRDCFVFYRFTHCRAALERLGPETFLDLC